MSRPGKLRLSCTPLPRTDIGRWSYETGAGSVWSRAVSVVALLVSSPRKHQSPYYREHDDSHSKSERGHAYPALLEFPRRTGEEKHCGKQNGVCQVLTGNVAGLSRFLLTACSFCGGVGSFSCPSYLIEVRQKWL